MNKFISSFDLVVVGGSATGVFAAVRAAEQGLRVALVENNSVFGGTATAGLVPIWHSMRSMNGEPLFAGLTKLIVDRLADRGEATRADPNSDRESHAATTFNSAALTIALDELVLEHPGIVPMLSTRFVAAEIDAPGHVTRIFVEDKDGRKALSAKFFIDASGDADLAERAGFETWKLPPCDMQAHTLCAIVANTRTVRKYNPTFYSFTEVLKPKNGGKFNHVFGWDAPVIGCPDVEFNAYTRVSGFDPTNAEDLTKATIEARLQLKRIIDHANKMYPVPEGEPKLAIVEVAPMLGIRESRHVKCLYKVTEHDVLYGKTYDDVVAKATYNIDIHENSGIRFKQLDGREFLIEVDESGDIRTTRSRWRPESEGVTDHYEVPYRAMVPVGSKNVLCAGRMLDCERNAYGAIRVMVNCNQMGEAAGVAAAKAVKEGLEASDAYAGYPADV